MGLDQVGVWRGRIRRTEFIQGEKPAAVVEDESVTRHGNAGAEAGVVAVDPGHHVSPTIGRGCNGRVAPAARISRGSGGGLIIGIGEKLGEIYWGPLLGGGIETWFAYVIALGFLVFRPQGLFGEKIIERI
jgi:hypothetical protein